MRLPACIAALFCILIASVQAQNIALLRPGDSFEMRLSGMPSEFAAEFALQYTINQSGTVNVPLIGEVKAAGLSSSDLERALQAKFISDKIFTRPTVIINVSAAARFVSVGGGIRAPQRLQWTQDLTLGNAVENCGGPDDFADPKKIRLIRDGKIFGVYNLKLIEKDPSQDPKVFPGDQIYIPKSAF